MKRYVFFGARPAGAPHLATLRQRPLVGFFSRVLQLLMLAAIVAIGLMSLGLMLIVAMVLGVYVTIRHWRQGRTGNFRIQFAVGR